MIVEPDICTSLHCFPPKEYCIQCSHAIYKGEVQRGDKTVKFEYNPRFGITFLTKRNKESKRVPKENDPVWDDVHAWIVKKSEGD